MARVVTPDRVFTVEYRQAEGWDGAIGQSAVRIQELRSHYSIGQNGWRWCRRCQALWFAGWAPCPAGGLHDHNGSSNYVLNSYAGDRDAVWRWCGKCQQLNSPTDIPGFCAAGGRHENAGCYTLFPVQRSTRGQSGWRRCVKCEVLVYGSHRAPCPGGGFHELYGEWRVANLDSEPWLTGQSHWRWCNKCQGLCYAGHAPCHSGAPHEWIGSEDYSLASLPLGEGGGQSGWRWCNKCQQLTYGGAPGACFAGGVHDHAGSSDYIVPQEYLRMNGQDGWRWCSKCQTLGYSLAESPGICPASGTHDYSQSAHYRLANFGADLSYLIGGARSAGDVFVDPGRGVRIVVNSINAVAGTAEVTLGFPRQRRRLNR
jgi:hypothetical protein